MAKSRPKEHGAARAYHGEKSERFKGDENAYRQPNEHANGAARADAKGSEKAEG